jgi:hypothetical protein
MRRAAKNTLFLFTGLVNEAYQRKDGSAGLPAAAEKGT